MSAHKGIVTWFNNAEGHGAISHTPGPDVSVHSSAIECDGYQFLCKGDFVEYDVETGWNGMLQAVRVRVISSSAC